MTVKVPPALSVIVPTPGAIAALNDKALTVPGTVIVPIVGVPSVIPLAVPPVRRLFVNVPPVTAGVPKVKPLSVPTVDHDEDPEPTPKSMELLLAEPLFKPSLFSTAVIALPNDACCPA